MAIAIISLIGFAQIVQANQVKAFIDRSTMLSIAVVFTQGGAQLQYDEFKKESKPFTFDQFSDQQISITAGLPTSIETLARLQQVTKGPVDYPGVIHAIINPRDIKYDSRIQIKTGKSGELVGIEITGPEPKKGLFSIFN